jgi:hypothetical protein
LTKTVYGVTIDALNEIPVATDDNGNAQCDTQIKYTINPAEYKAASANMVIYKDGVQEGAYIPVETQGSGFGLIAKGTPFDPEATYQAKVILNYGSDAEIESEMITLKPGALRITSVSVQDLELHQSILPEDTVTFVATYIGDVNLQWSVTPSEPDIKVSINATSGELAVDPKSQEGWVIVRAADKANPCIHRDAYVYIGCLPCDGDGNCKHAAVYDVSSIDIKIGLGRTVFGGAAGQLVIKADRPSPLLLTPAGLQVSTLSTDFDERLDDQKQLRQLLTAEYLVDIVTLDHDAYEIVFYRAEDVTGEVDGLYVVGSESY